MSSFLVVSNLESVESLRIRDKSYFSRIKDLEIRILPYACQSKLTQNEAELVRATGLTFLEAIKSREAISIVIGEFGLGWKSAYTDCCSEYFLDVFREKLYLLTKIKVLELSIFVDSEKARAFIKEIPFLPSLTSISISVSLPFSTCSFPLADLSVRKMPFLKELVVRADSNGTQDSEFFIRLPAIINEIKAPQVLKLEFSNWSKEKNLDLTKIYAALASKNLISFGLNIPDEESKQVKSSLTTCIRNWQHLEQLDLSYDFRSDLEAQEIITSLSKNITILRLSLESNVSISDSFCDVFLLETIAGRYNKLISLTLKLKNTVITMKGYKNIANSLKCAQTIRNVVLHIGTDNFMLGLSDLIDKEFIGLFLRESGNAVEALRILYNQDARISYGITYEGESPLLLDIWAKTHLDTSFRGILRSFQKFDALKTLEAKISVLNIDHIATQLFRDFLTKHISNLISLSLVTPSQFLPPNSIFFQSLSKCLVSLKLDLLSTDKNNQIGPSPLLNIFRLLQCLTEFKCTSSCPNVSELELKLQAFRKGSRRDDKLLLGKLLSQRKRNVHTLYSLKTQGLKQSYRRCRQVTSEILLDFLLF